MTLLNEIYLSVKEIVLSSVSARWLSFRNTRCGMPNDTHNGTVPSKTQHPHSLFQTKKPPFRNIRNDRVTPEGNARQCIKRGNRESGRVSHKKALTPQYTK